MGKKVIVCQLGSRHRYLIPKVINDSGMLYRLYTDSTAYSFIGKVALLLDKICKVPQSVKRLTKRIPAIPKSRLFSTDLFFFRETFLKCKTKDKFAHIASYYNGIGKECIKWGLGDCDCIYNMYIENIDFLRYAKANGKKVVVDIYEVPTTYGYLVKEIDNNKEYACLNDTKTEYLAQDKIRMELMDEILKLADFYTVPSKFVIKSLSYFRNFNPSKVLYLPYASSIKPTDYSYKPVKHRLIWVGNDVVRKGLLYCAKAASILKKKYPDLDFRIIGCVPDNIKQSDYFSDLNFLGVLSKPELQEEYRSAEAYVFPTLFEGFAGTIIEAASCGCPIITTECAGTDPDVFPAIYIPTHDVNSIIDAVTNIFENSNMRNELSQKVYGYSSNLSPETYKENLIGYLKKV